MYKIPLCRCSHDKSTHHEGKYCCLAMLCDCTSYRDETKLEPPRKQAAIPMPPPDDEECPITPRMFHPFWCMCPQCLTGLPP